MPFNPDEFQQAYQAGQKKKASPAKPKNGFDEEEFLRTYGGDPLAGESEFRAAVVDTAKKSTLPLAGQIIGTGLGMMAGPAAPFAVPALEASLGMAGEGLNQALGITEKDNKQLLLQGAIPFGTRLLGKLAAPSAPLIPPSTRGAEFLNRIAAPEARRRMSMFAAPESEALFNRAMQSGAQFHTGDTLATINREIQGLASGANGRTLYGRTIGILEGLRDRLTETGGTLSPRAYQTELRDLGAALRGAEGRTLNQAEKGAVQQVYGRLAQALDREAIPRRGPAGSTPESIMPDVMPDETGTALTVPRQQGPIDRGMQTGTPLQPNVPSTRVILPGMQTNQPVPFQAGAPGVRQADEIIPAPQAPPRSGPDIRVSSVDEPQPAPRPSATGNQNAMAAQDLIQARTYVKRQTMLDEIEESITKAEGILRGQGDKVQFNAASVLRDLKKNPFWNGTKGERNPAFTPQEKRQIEDIFTMLNGIPALAPGAGQSAGSFQVARALKGSLFTGGGAAAASGGDPIISGAATAIGTTIPTLTDFARVLTFALKTQTGRQEIMKVLRQPNPTIPSITAKLTGVLTSSQASPGPVVQRPMTMQPTPFAMEQ